MGSGIGATVCLTTNGTPHNIQLNWTAKGTIRSFEVYRDNGANPQGRSRLAVVSKSATAYIDGTAVNGAPYLYWLKFIRTPTPTTRVGRLPRAA